MGDQNELELTIIGNCLAFPETLQGVLTELSPGDFSSLKNKAIFNGIKHCFDSGEPLEPLPISQHIDGGFHVEPSDLIEIQDRFASSSASLPHYIGEFKEQSQRRKLIVCLEEGARNLRDPNREQDGIQFDILEEVKGIVAAGQAGKVHERGFGEDLLTIMSRSTEEKPHLIENLLMAGDKGFVVSSYKIGKTLFMIQMTLCLAMAVPFLGFNIPKARKVLYIRFELKDQRFKERLNLILPALGGIEKVMKVPIFHLTRGFDIRQGKDFRWLTEMIYKHEPEALFLDPFYKLANLNIKDDPKPVIDRFDTLKEKFPELQVSIAHHLRKQVAGVKDNSWDAAYGSMFYFADMDYEIRLVRKSNHQATFEFSHISNDVPLENFTFKRNPYSLLYELETTEDTETRWLGYAARAIEKVQTGGDAFKQKGNLKTWFGTEFNLTGRETGDLLDFLFEKGRLVWTGRTSMSGHIEVPNESV